MSVEVELATSKDMYILEDLLQEHHAECYALDADMNPDYDRISEALINEDAYLIIAFDCGVPVAYAFAAIFNDLFSQSKLAAIQSLYVNPDYRQIGLWKYMVEQIQLLAEGQGCKGLLITYMSNRVPEIEGFKTLEVTKYKEL